MDVLDTGEDRRGAANPLGEKPSGSSRRREQVKEGGEAEARPFPNFRSSFLKVVLFRTVFSSELRKLV